MYSVSEVMVFTRASELTPDVMERTPVPPPPPRPPASTDGSMIVVGLLGAYTAYWFWSRRQAAIAAAMAKAQAEAPKPEVAAELPKEPPPAS